jgi:hypothetical protein
MSRNSMISHEKSGLEGLTFRVQPRPRQMAAFPLTFSACVLLAWGHGWTRFHTIRDSVRSGRASEGLHGRLYIHPSGSLEPGCHLHLHRNETPAPPPTVSPLRARPSVSPTGGGGRWGSVRLSPWPNSPTPHGNLTRFFVLNHLRAPTYVNTSVHQKEPATVKYRASG